MICNHCGKEVESLSGKVADLHDQGMTVLQIRAELGSRIAGNDARKYAIIRNLLLQVGRTPRVLRGTE